jgi:hypothetical protein
LVLLL